MNPWQLAQQLRHVLARVAWEDGSGAVVFGQQGVIVTAGPVSDEALPGGFPFAIVTVDSGSPDPDDPSLLLQSFSIVAAVQVFGDNMGEFAVIGGARADLGKSTGAGILEVGERVRSAVQSMTGADGAALVVSATGTAAPTPIGQGRHIVTEEFRVTALCTSQPVYTAPQELTRGGSTWRWNGDQCAARFDFLRFRLGYITGSDPADTPGDLTAVAYTGTGTEAAASTSAGRVYQVFADYHPRGTGAVEYSSEGAVVGAYVAT